MSYSNKILPRSLADVSERIKMEPEKSVRRPRKRVRRVESRKMAMGMERGGWQSALQYYYRLLTR